MEHNLQMALQDIPTQVRYRSPHIQSWKLKCENIAILPNVSSKLKKGSCSRALPVPVSMPPPLMASQTQLPPVWPLLQRSPAQQRPHPGHHGQGATAGADDPHDVWRHRNFCLPQTKLFKLVGTSYGADGTV